MQRPALGMQRVRATCVVLGLQKPGQHLLPRPPGVALRGPGVVVLRLSAQVDHGIHRAAAAQHLAAGLKAAAAIQSGLGHGVDRPVELAGLGHARDAGRALHQRAGISAPGLEQAHLVRTVLAQAASQHAARRACADDHEIKGFIHAARSPGLKTRTLRACCGKFATIFPAFQSLTGEITL